MRPLFTFIAFIFSFTGMETLRAQGPYVSAAGAYNWQWAPTNLGNAAGQSYNNGALTFSSFNYSLGGGKSYGGRIGYALDDHFAIELALNYLDGSPVSFTQEFSDSLKFHSKLSAKMLRCAPMLVMSPGYRGINPYLRFGLMVSKGKIYTEDTRLASFGTTIVRRELSEGIALGWVMGLGAEYRLYRRFMVFLEFETVNMSYAPEKGITTASLNNGSSNLERMTVRERETEYVDQLTSASTDPDKPTQYLKTRYNFSSMGVNVGLRFHLNMSTSRPRYNRR